MGFPRWQGASRCTSGPQPGALALMRWIMEEFSDEGSMNWGIYNCRSVRGGSTTSAHGEGRALDVGFRVGNPAGDRLLRLLLKVPGRLGIQAIIYERKIYSALSPNGRPYTGVAPHFDHLHIELTREAGEKLTYATVKKAMDHARGVYHKPGTRSLSVGKEGADVKVVQQKVGAKIDGIYGPKTKELVERFEAHNKKKYPRLVVDGNVGKLTWHALGITPKY